MMGITALASAVWQGQDLVQQGTVSGSDVHWLMIFAGIAAFALLLQSLLLLGAGIGAVITQRKVSAEIALLKVKILDQKVMPLVDKAGTLMTDLTPQVRDISAKVASISANVEHISLVVREKVEEFGPTISAANETVREANATVQGANRKTQQQVERVNGMVTGVLDATVQVGKKIQAGINVPVREASGIVEGVKTAWHTFLRVNMQPKAKVYRAPVGTYEPSATPPAYPLVPETSAPDPFVADVYAKEKPDLEP